MIEKIKNYFNIKKLLLQADKPLLITIIIIIVFGLVVLFTSTSVVAYSKYQNPYFYFNRQLFFLIAGLFTFFFFFKIEYQRLKKISLFFLIASIVLLVLTFVPGISLTINGSRSWLNFGLFTIQPSEFVKLTLLIYLSALLGQYAKQDYELKKQKIIVFFVILSIIGLLMMAQPDIGTLIIIILSSMTVFFIYGGQIKNVIILSIIALAALFLYFLYNDNAQNQTGGSYLRYRFICLFETEKYAQTRCYQNKQSLIAIGSGGLWGKGLGNSRQKYLFLPEIQNDFIFAIIAEEMGLVVSLAVLFLYLMIIYRGVIIAKKTQDLFGKNLAIGISSWLTIQALINIGGITGVIPMTGVPLPFISAGGSSLISSLAAVGVLAGISTKK